MRYAADTLAHEEMVLIERKPDVWASLRYFPAEGLKVTRTERNGRPDQTAFTLAAEGNQLMVTKSLLPAVCQAL